MGENEMIKVLLADDQELIRQSLEIVLSSKEGITITEVVANGQEVIRSVRKNRPDVILMDIRMPVMDGVQCTEIIKQRYPDIKIIVLTTFDDDEYIFSALRHGASGYLLKGISMDELVGAIRMVYTGGALMTPEIATKVLNKFSQMSQAEAAIQVEAGLQKHLLDHEWKIIRQIGLGLSNKEIAKKLFLSEGTVRNYISSTLSKLDLRDRTQLAIWAVQTGLVTRMMGE
jgi:DNA-binding NarL/FixJ family response regulator